MSLTRRNLGSEIDMTVRPRLTYLLLVPIAALPPTGIASAVAQDHLSILDSVVHLEERIHTEIPPTPRWEERLGLTARLVSVGDARLYVEEEGRGIPLVLINGGPGGTHHGFHPWFGRARDFARVIYYDQRGTGLSDYEPGESGYSVEQAVNDLDALRRSLGIDSWVLLGFSYGGFLAQYYTATYPENVRGLVLVGASPGLWADLGESRQHDFITPAETQRMREIRARLQQLSEDESWTQRKHLELLVYNNHLNGDWKRQHFYRPTGERSAQIALYEWVHDGDFNSVMSQSQEKVDLSGAFDVNPIPTLILEGKWDLTWGDEKPTLLSRNHPNARMVVIEGAGHSIFNENPEAFFADLERFLREIAPPDPAELESFQEHLSTWRARWKSSPRYHLKAAGWGRSGSRAIAEAYGAGWLEKIDHSGDFLRLGFALYDLERYEAALAAFCRMEDRARSEGDRARSAMALIWQGHMLDLLGRREEALALYQRVVDMKLEDGVQHSQYDLTYAFSPYAAERLRSPFRRIENRLP
jgi:proline iminopeptidase